MAKPDTFVMSPGDVYHLDKALLKAGYTPADVTALRSGENAARVLGFLRGTSEIRILTHVINLRSSPKIPKGSGWILVSDSLFADQLVWDSSRIGLVGREALKEQVYSTGEARSYFQKYTPGCLLTDRVLDYLLEHQELIPSEWEEKHVHFLGTVYGDSEGRELVRTLFRCNRGFWQDGRRFLKDVWTEYDHAAFQRLS